MKPLKVKCYVLKKGNIFFAASITLNLTATGNTLKEAKQNLDILIKDYLHTVSKNRTIDQFKHLLNRSVPFYMYVDYTICAVCHFLSKGKANEPCTFEEIIPYNVQFAN